MMKKILFTLMLFAFTTLGFAQTATDGDYRSLASGNWSDANNWQVRSGGGSWATASAAPTALNNVYIQNAHNITVDAANVNCKDLNINTTSTVTIGTNVLNVSGKIRAFTGTAEVTAVDGSYTGTSTTILATTMITTTAPGVLKFIGATRNITTSGEWNVSATVNDVEFALSAGAIGTLAVGVKFKNITISSGTITTSQSMSVGLGASDAFTIKNGATFISSRGAATTDPIMAFSTTAKCNTVTIESGGTLELTGAFPTIDCTTFNNNGTVNYKGAAQTFLKPSTATSGTGAATINNYHNLILSGSGNKTSSNAFRVSNRLELLGTVALIATQSTTNVCTMLNGSTIYRESTAGTVISTFSVIVLGTAATDLVNVTIGGTCSVSGEFSPTQAPGKVGTFTINSGVTYTIGGAGSRSMTNFVNNGILSISGQSGTTTINGTISGTGTITGGNNANLAIGGTAGGSAGTLTFTSGSQNLNNLTINRTGESGSVTLGSNLSVAGNVVLTNGIINIAPSQTLNLAATSNTTGGSSSNFINTQSSGANVGKIVVPGVVASKTIHVGSGTKYLPITLSPASSSAFTINVFEGATADATPNSTALTAGQKVDLVDAIYNIERTSGTGNCDVTLGWTTALEGTNFGAFTDAEVGVAQYTGGAYTGFTGPGNQTANTITTTVSSFAPFLIGKAGTTLPVKIVSFTAKAVNQTSLLAWESISEVNLDKYNVQSSLDGVNFETIGSVKANNKPGVFNYSFIDKSPSFGSNYYRLISVDLDGTSEATGITSVNFGSTVSLSVYPNPTQGQISISGLVKGDLVKITDLIGRTIKFQEYLGDDRMSINIESVNAGVYLLSVESNGKISYSNRIIKN
jgi:hypothetical protein